MNIPQQIDQYLHRAGDQSRLKTAIAVLQYSQTVLKTAVAGCESGF